MEANDKVRVMLFRLLKSWFASEIAPQAFPRKGSIVMCGLAFDLAEHTGIYVGNGKIVELQGNGRIRKVTAERFLRGGDGFPVRTGLRIFVACHKAKPIRCKDTATRAKARVGDEVLYNVRTTNCHWFTAGCIRDDHIFASGAFSSLESDISMRLNGGRPIKWRVWEH